MANKTLHNFSSKFGNLKIQICMIKKRNCKSSFDKIFYFKKCKSKFFSNLDAHQEKLCLYGVPRKHFFECDTVYSYRYSNNEPTGI